MKVLNVCSNFDPVTGGGEAERTFQMTRFLQGAGVDCRVLTVDNGLGIARKNGLGKDVVVALPCFLRRFYVPRVSIGRLRELVNASDVIHLIGHWTVLNAMVYWACRRSGKPYVVCPAGALRIFGRSRFLKKIYSSAVGNRIMRNAMACIAVTNDEKQYFISRGILPEKVVVIPNGIAETDFLSQDVDGFRRKYALGTDPYILFMGRLNAIKGPDLLLEAYAKAPDVAANINLVFVGPDGGLLESLKAASIDQGIEHRTHFIGYLAGDDKSDAYHGAKLLVVPSRHEAMSIVAIESGMCGTPVLLTDQCGFEDLQSAGSGWVVPATVDGIRLGIERVLIEPGTIAIAAGRIKPFIKHNFTWEVVVNSYIGLFTSLKREARFFDAR